MRINGKKPHTNEGEDCPHCGGTGKVKASCATRFMALRQKHGLDQMTFANRIGVSRSQVANLETGRTAPSVDLLLRIADQFPDVSTDWLLGR